MCECDSSTSPAAAPDAWQACVGAQVEPNGKLKLSRKAVLLADLAAGTKPRNGGAAGLPVVGDIVRCARSSLSC